MGISLKDKKMKELYTQADSSMCMYPYEIVGKKKERILYPQGFPL
jgi:hypothetical protein